MGCREVDRDRLVAALAKGLPAPLAGDLVDSYLAIRHDAATKTYGRTAPGKFVETLVQVLQHMATGSYSVSPNVDDFLKNRVEQHTALGDGLRICAARLARAMYSLRSKRSIAHKGDIDPNSHDLALLHAGARWILAELLRNAHSIPMEEAGGLIDLVHAPVGQLVEEIGGRRIVHGCASIRDEILVLLHSHYPDQIDLPSILSSLDLRKPGSVRAQLSKLYAARLVDGNAKDGYRLTARGFNTAVGLVVGRAA